MNKVVCYTLKAVLILLALLVTILIVTCALNPLMSEISTNNVIVEVQKLSSKEQQFLSNLLINNKIHTQEFMFERIISFYELLITYLIAFLGIGGILTFLYIRLSHRIDIREEISNAFISDYVKQLMSAELGKLINKEKEEGDLKIQADAMQLINERLDFVEKAVNNFDNKQELQITQKTDI